MKLKFTLLALVFAVVFTAQAQENSTQPADYVGTVASMRIEPSLASKQNLERPIPLTEAPNDGRSSRLKPVIGKDQQTENDYFARNRNRLEGMIANRPPSLVFNLDNNVSSPSDPALAVGPDHVMMVYNTGFSIYGKDGVEIMGPLNVNNIFSGGGCCDLTVSYDNAADRWVISYLFIGNGIEVAVSDGPDPTTANWFVYSIPQVNDYNKLSVWSDGYYVTDNTGSSNKVWAMERAEMILGNPSAGIQGFDLPGIVTDGFFSPQALNVTNDDLPAAGGATIIFHQDDAYTGVTEDHIKLWTIDVDWATPANSTVSAPTELPATPFIGVFDGGSFSNLAQPGGGAEIDALQATIMNQAQFRKFPNHNSAIFNFVVDTDASGGELAGVRWYELRQDDDNMPWTVFQEGTYTAPDAKHAWHASMAMDVLGNIGMGYSGMSTSASSEVVRVSSFYTGRFASDPLNTMTITEELISNGTQNIGGFRYGDYSKIDVDPTDNKTFWFINEYNAGGQNNVVGVFKIAPDFDNDAGVVSIDTPLDGTLTAAENVTVTVFNFGENDQTDLPIELIVDGTSVATEMVSGTLASQTSIQYTFMATVDMSVEGQVYAVTAQTNLGSDEDNNNDAASRDIQHVFANDIGVTEITAPENGEGLGSETVTVTIENFGAASQSNFDVSYTVNGGAAVTENVPGPVDAGTTASFTFATPADLSVTQAYDFVATTSLAGDSDTTNDATSKTVVNLSCTTSTNDTDFSVGPDQGTVTESPITVTDDFLITGVQVTINLAHTFMGDLEIFLDAPDGTTVQLFDRTGGGGNDMLDTTFSDNATDPIDGGTPPYGGFFQPVGNLSDFDGLSSLGDWTLRIVDNANADGGTLQDWSLQLCDDLSLGLDDNFAVESELIIVDNGNDQFSIQLPTTTVTDRLEMRVTNMLGQKLLSQRIDNNGSGYSYDLDMSYAAAGVYIVTIGNTNGTTGKAKRLIVR